MNNENKKSEENVSFFDKHKKALIISFVVILVIGFSFMVKDYYREILGSYTGNSSSNNTTNANTTITTKETTTIARNKVNVIDFSSMSKDDINNWCSDNKVKCSFYTEYSDEIAKGGFVSQSVDPDSEIYEEDRISIYYSDGKKPTIGHINALKKAEEYSNLLHMSKKGIYNQLISEYGEGFTKEEAQYAIDNLNVDYKENALAKAKEYSELLHMSKKGIYNQLISEYGEGFTKEEAQYAVDHLFD